MGLPLLIIVTCTTMSIPNTKPTESHIYFQPVLDKGKKVQALVNEAFQKFARKSQTHIQLQQFTKFITYCFEKKLIEHPKGLQGLISEICKNWNAPKNRREVEVFLQACFSDSFEQQGQQGHGGQGQGGKGQEQGKGKIIFENLMFDILPKNEKEGKKISKDKLKEISDKMFLKYDANQTGLLDYLELSNLLKSEFNQKYSYFQCLKMCDKNKDGMISPAEFLVFIQKVYN